MLYSCFQPCSGDQDHIVWSSPAPLNHLSHCHVSHWKPHWWRLLVRLLIHRLHSELLFWTWSSHLTLPFDPSPSWLPWEQALRRDLCATNLLRTSSQEKPIQSGRSRKWKEASQAKPQRGQGNLREASRQGSYLTHISHCQVLWLSVCGAKKLQKPKGSLLETKNAERRGAEKAGHATQKW